MQHKQLWVLVSLTLLNTMPCLAATTGLPWDTPWTIIRNSMTGPVAAGIGAIAVGAGGITYAFHGEIEHYVRKVSGTVLALGAAVGAWAFMTAIYAVRSATV